MTITKEARTELARRLFEQYAEFRSWRKAAKKYYPPCVTFQTLNRIALSGGEWIPKDRAVLQALGLVKAKAPEPEHTRKIKRKIAKMAKDTRKAILEE